jgi:hypothetical protein
MATSQLRPNHVDGDGAPDSGRSDENDGASQRDSTQMVAQSNGREGRPPFQLFGRNWGFQLHGGRKREVTRVASSTELQDEDSIDEEPTKLGSR